MDINALHKLLEDTTVLLRKGADVTHRSVGGVDVVTIQVMPHEDEGLPPFTKKIDLVLVTVGVLPVAHERRAELVKLLNTYPQPERLAGGPSYIEVGAVIGDQGAALRLIALGHVLRLWNVITPATLGMGGEQAREAAGAGWVMTDGYRPPAPAEV